MCAWHHSSHPPPADIGTGLKVLLRHGVRVCMLRLPIPSHLKSHTCWPLAWLKLWRDGVRGAVDVSVWRCCVARVHCVPMAARPPRPLAHLPCS
jgi:hypothetical protein